MCVATTVERLCSATTAGGGSGCSSPPPRCADGPACARFAGATVQSCTDTENGYKATCCFAVGTLPAPSAGGPGGTTDPGGADGGVPSSDAGVIGPGGDAGAKGGTSGGGTGATNGTGGVTGGVMCEQGATCQPGQRCGAGLPAGGCMECTCDGAGHLACMPCPDKPDGGGAGASTGAGGMTGGGGGATTGTGGTTGGVMCQQGATCQPGQRCGAGLPAGGCMECTCDGAGHFACVPCPDKPDGGGTGATTGTGGMTGGEMCMPGLTCQPGQRCGAGLPGGACMECTCDPSGVYVCMPCPTGMGGTTGGGAGATTGTAGVTGGGEMCVAGATCMPGQRCGGKSPDGACMECTCDPSGLYGCMPCPMGTGGTTGGGAGATTGTAGMTGGGTMCMSGATCMPGQRCGGKSPDGACMECTCDPGGLYVCMPCPTGMGGTTGGGAGATTGTAGTGGSATGPCDVMSMPAPDVGLPCTVNEYCPNGSNYRVRCDGATGACVCIADGIMKPGPAMSCATFDPIAALVGCGFPDGKL